MVIKSLEQRKRQQILLIVALVIFLAAVLVLYFGFWKKEKIVTTEEVPQALPQEEEEEQIPTVLEEKLIRISLNFEFLNQKILPFLKIHGDLPVKKGQTGRDNPFVPY